MEGENFYIPKDLTTIIAESEKVRTKVNNAVEKFTDFVEGGEYNEAKKIREEIKYYLLHIIKVEKDEVSNFVNSNFKISKELPKELPGTEEEFNEAGLEELEDNKEKYGDQYNA